MIMEWIPIDKGLPPVDEDGYSDNLLLSFGNASFICIGEYRTDDEGGAFYEGDSEKSLIAEFGLIVNAWMPVPKSYREEEG